MSLESDVANLVTQTNSLLSYFQTRKAGIDAAVAAAIAAAPETSRSWYVDPVNGLDTNKGTQAEPFKTINKAIAVTPPSGVCTAYIMDDYDMPAGIGSLNSVLIMIGVAKNGVRPKLKPKYVTSTDANSVTTTNMTGFNMYLASNLISIRDMDIYLPSPAGLNPAPNNARAGSFFRGFSSVNVPTVFNVSLENVAVTMAADWFGNFIGVTSSSVVLATTNVSFPSGFAGRYVSNVAAGALVKDLGHVMSNLASL
ncbi:hypothetical protein DV532_08425 [Pseudomonas sp. Leaf58]|uniref:DUF1565 domain-containing protein n=1 Tax=Pseudomonas sp. Leaf58 TaxID=1736226 RepID=UPI0006F69034|nr:DUF1565 domain-containing protein [Pseudomonas sp. Leaf58]AYG44323.1 hypothetical protein DV532_08425 [Pseudomonas sp. Leaf58]KQN57627.1 hypothetical protein ASF02_25615 [Pseudomonas sp. Leaf58]